VFEYLFERVEIPRGVYFLFMGAGYLVMVLCVVRLVRSISKYVKAL
jgi:hypothetical protein